MRDSGAIALGLLQSCWPLGFMQAGRSASQPCLRSRLRMGYAGASFPVAGLFCSSGDDLFDLSGVHPGGRFSQARSVEIRPLGWDEFRVAVFPAIEAGGRVDSRRTEEILFPGIGSLGRITSQRCLSDIFDMSA